MMWGNMWNYGNVGWGWMLFGWVSMVLFWGAIIWLIWWAITRLGQRPQQPGGAPSPLEIAKVRYARGEITKEQYEQIKKDIA